MPTGNTQILVTADDQATAAIEQIHLAALEALATSYIDRNMVEAGYYLRGMIDRAYDTDNHPLPCWASSPAYRRGYDAVQPGDVVTGEMALQATGVKLGAMAQAGR